jgi:hypothetical protein
MTLAASEFIRRFLLHVLPKGFMRIRHYGYLANRHRQEKLTLCRRLWGESPSRESSDNNQRALAARDEGAAPMITCPVCQQGQLRIVHSWDRYSPNACQQPVPPAMRARPREDSS